MSSIREGTVVAGKYQIERPLTRGGMGSIWVARHLKLDMRVAVKLMAPALAETEVGRARFEREARAVALIQSPNVAQIHDYGVEDGTPYIVMELLAGEDLGARLQRGRRLPISAVAAIFAQIAKALRRAHDAGIVHRDLKPANVFLARSDEDEIVKLLDFGIAKLNGTGSAEEATATGVVLGSIHYMSPEQARGVREVDHRSDLWSLGVIAFRAIVGRLPSPAHSSATSSSRSARAHPAPLVARARPRPRRRPVLRPRPRPRARRALAERARFRRRPRPARRPRPRHAAPRPRRAASRPAAAAADGLPDARPRHARALELRAASIRSEIPPRPTFASLPAAEPPTAIPEAGPIPRG